MFDFIIHKVFASKWHSQDNTSFWYYIFQAPTIKDKKYSSRENWDLSSYFLLHQIMSSVILVTGGSGLVGKAIEWVIENDKTERYGKKEGEQWIFLTSKDGDLRQVSDRCNETTWGLMSKSTELSSFHATFSRDRGKCPFCVALHHTPHTLLMHINLFFFATDMLNN